VRVAAFDLFDVVASCSVSSAGIYLVLVLLDRWPPFNDEAALRERRTTWRRVIGDVLVLPILVALVPGSFVLAAGKRWTEFIATWVLYAVGAIVRAKRIDRRQKERSRVADDAGFRSAPTNPPAAPVEAPRVPSGALEIREDAASLAYRMRRMRHGFSEVGPVVRGLALVAGLGIVVSGVVNDEAAGRSPRVLLYVVAFGLLQFHYWMPWLFGFVYRLVGNRWVFQPDRILFRGHSYGSMTFETLRTASLTSLADFDGYRVLAVGNKYQRGTSIIVPPEISDERVLRALPQGVLLSVRAEPR